MTNTTDSDISRRFLDADEEPNKTLLPIEGYEQKPLVSLEEAVKPLSTLLPNLDVKVATAKENSCRPKDDLTVDESAAIHLYSMQWIESNDSLYSLLNQTLRSKHRNNLKPWFLYLKLFLTALYKLPSIKGTIWRGIQGDVSDQYNEDIVWWGVSSCTETMTVMQQFVGNSGVRTLFTIECIHGKAIRPHSYYNEESEILLMPGTYFRVVDKWSPAKDLYMIHLREEIAPWQTIAPPFELPPSNDENVPIQNFEVSKTKDLPNAHTESAKSIVQSFPNISVNAKWTQYGVTIAGGHGRGDGFHQLYMPIGLYVDEDRTIYIADSLNHRIVKWKCGATYGQVVAGGNGQGTRADQLSEPTDVIIEKQTDSLIICDWGNRRVMRCSCQNGTSGDMIISLIDCSRLTMDDQGLLYVSDYRRNEVRRYRAGEAYGTVVAGGHGQGDYFNQLHWPTHVFVDRDHSVYVSELNNHRVTKWVNNAQEGIVMGGGRGPGGEMTQLSSPRGMIVDPFGSVYVADCGNHRVVRWFDGAAQGNVIVGGNGVGNGANQLSWPVNLTFDRDGNLYVVDQNNHRVQRFDIKQS